ncbi:hypothetical protein AB1207_21445 [Kineococcus endophyticus]|uniref:MinD-like ATPase involved in chromosome partitioning or flagellar assembly n=1 Tax=Kineococcus endophyticus TaxID=1181883 RepID=A0ABV3PCE9_9ACTN
MGVVTFLSAKGSPGVTTTALLATALWPRPALLLEADPAGGDVAARVLAADGGLLDTSRGLLPLLTAARRGLDAASVVEQAQPVAGGSRVVLGLSGPEQAAAAGRGWAALAAAVAELSGPSAADGDLRSTDVLVDAGRVGAAPVHLDLLRASDCVVLLVRADVAAVLHARDRLRLLGGALRRRDGLLPRTGVVVVGDPGRRAGEAASAVEALRAVGPWVDDLGRLPHDPAGAGVFAGAPVSRPERTALVRAGRTVVDDLVAGLPVAPPAAAAATDQESAA